MAFGVTDGTSNPFVVVINGERIDNGNVVVNVWLTPIGQLTPIASFSFQLDPLKAKVLGIQLQDEVKGGRQN
jgi:hypothetical protein